VIITFGMPIVGDLPGDALETHLRLLFRLGREAERWGHKVRIRCPQNTFPHDRARIEVLESARKDESDLIFFVDADTLVPNGAFEELLKVLQQNNAAMVTGHYFRRGFPFTCVWSRKVDGEFFQVDASDGIHEIDTCGLGCALIDLKWVLKNVSPPYFTMETDDRSSIVADDTSFCTRIKNAGGRILGHAGVRCIHLGHRQAVCDQTVSELRKWYFQQQQERR
jgi:cellulose synthase/poly-beta-1,6-N-acetylglucosamine synthase-like glycosyltransferase